MNWKNAVTAIRVPLQNGNAKFGTAFLVRQDLLLTTHHVLYPDDRDTSKKVQVQWKRPPQKWLDRLETNASQPYWWDLPENKDKDAEWFELPGEDPVVWSCKYHDVALLRVVRDDGGTDLCMLNLNHPEDKMTWNGIGFPKAGKQKGTREAVSFDGTVHRAQDGNRWFEIGVGTGKPNTRDGWVGASGMPIVVDGRVIGVCLEAPPDFDNGRLRAAPLCDLWEEQRDCHTPLRVHFPEAAEYEKLRGKIVAAMVAFVREGEGKGFNAFARRLDFSEKIPSTLTNEEKAEIAVDVMLGHSVKDVLLALKHAMVDVSSKDALCPKISMLVQTIAPLVFRITGPTAQWIEKAAAQGGGVVFSPFGTWTMAEVVVAGAQGRSLDFLGRADEYDGLPIGRHLLPLVPVFGTAHGGNPILTAVIEEMGRWMDLPNLGKSEPFDLSVVNTLNVKMGAQSELEEISELRECFRDRVIFGESVPYLAIVLPKDEAQKQLLLDAVQRLTAPDTGIPDLFVISLDKAARGSDRSTLAGIPYFVPIVSN